MWLRIVVLVLSVAAGPLPAAEPTAEEVLERMLAYHDPEDAWSKKPLEITAELRYGERIAKSRGYDGRTDRVRVDNAAGRFEYHADKGGDRIEIVGEGDRFSARLNGSSKISAADRNEHRLNPEQLPTWRDYFTYIYGLPMKLRDPGTRLDPDVARTTFNEREVLSLRVTYAEEVGKDIWYFYVDPENWALTGCRFFHDESKNDGEYIVYEGEIEGPHGMRLPKLRHWYTNRDGEFLATDDVVALRPHPSPADR
jgi:hypothetical protein